MSHYIENPGMCRVDFFKESGKWYTTEAIDLSPWYTNQPYDALTFALKKHLLRKEGSGYRLSGMWAICLEPYNHLSFPLMMKVDFRY